MADDGHVSFADEVAASLPSKIALPGELRTALDWLERQGCVHTYRRRPDRYCDLYPPGVTGGTSLVTFEVCDAAMSKAYVRGTVEGMARLAPIIRTGGDGSYAALWLDDDGRQRFVHLGSGSGSTWLGVICDSPVDMLRLMAIGYDELCWDEHFGQSPAAAYDGDEPYLGPVAFRAFVETTFGVKVPGTAAEIVKQPASMMDKTSDDPFWRWMKAFD